MLTLLFILSCVFLSLQCTTNECCTNIDSCTACVENNGCDAFVVSLAGEFEQLKCLVKGSDKPTGYTEVLDASVGCEKENEDKCETYEDCVTCGNDGACQWCNGLAGLGASCSTECIKATKLEECPVDACTDDACCKLLADNKFGCLTCFGNPGCKAYVTGFGSASITTCLHKDTTPPAIGKPVSAADGCEGDTSGRCGELSNDCNKCIDTDGCFWCEGSGISGLFNGDGCTDSCDKPVEKAQCPTAGADEKCGGITDCKSCNANSLCDWCNTSGDVSGGVINVFACRHQCEDDDKMATCGAISTLASFNIVLFACAAFFVSMM